MNHREQIAYWGGAVLIALFSSAIFVNTTFLQPRNDGAGNGLIISTRDMQRSTGKTRPRTLPLARTHVRVRVEEPRRAARATMPKVRRTASLGRARTDVRSPLIAQVQRKLARMGYDPGPIDGRLGPATRTAIAKFQKANNMPPTGEIEPGVLALLLP